ncbi:MAG: hypothetical protein SFY56_00915 [Bacteroidota bacterium]|nr:hypothetical protein [Bacteroidota bacterium]
MRHLFCVIFFFFFQWFYAQQLNYTDLKKGYTTNFILFKTASDFFEQKNGVVYPVREIVLNKLKCIDTITNKKYTVNLIDSGYFGFNLKGYGSESIKYIKYGKSYYTFGGGTQSFCFITTYDINNGFYVDNYLSAFSIIDPGSLQVYYIKDGDENSCNSDFALVAKDKSELILKYKQEKKDTDKYIWKKNLLKIAIKFTKKYNNQ